MFRQYQLLFYTELHYADGVVAAGHAPQGELRGSRLSTLVQHLITDWNAADRRGVELQDFAFSKGLTPEMMRAILRGRSELGEDSLGRLLVAVDNGHSCGRTPGATPRCFEPDCVACLYEVESFAYLRERGHRPRISRPRQNKSKRRSLS